MNVIDGRSLGLWFDLPRKRLSTRYFGVHWTGGSDAGTVAEQAGRVFGTLAARGDQIHFIGCADGTIVQVADLASHAVHIGSAHNDDTIGCEFVCPGSSGVTPSVPRPKFTSTVHGHQVTYWGFTSAQVAAAAQLAQGLLWRYGIAYVRSPVCVADELDIPAGVMGHYQTAQDRADPGPETMHQIRSAMVDSKLGAGVLALGLGVGLDWYRRRH